MHIADILKIKGSRVLMVRPADTIETLAKRLRDNGVGAMIVSEKGVIADGIIPERDVAHGLATHGAAVLSMPVSRPMTRIVITCALQDLAVIRRQGDDKRARIRHLRVKDDGRIVGLVSIGDILKHRLEEMQLETNVLRDYAISSRGMG